MLNPDIREQLGLGLAKVRVLKQAFGVILRTITFTFVW